MAGQGEKGQEAVGGALLKLLGGCPCAVLGLPQLMAAGMEGSPAGLLSLLRAKAGRWDVPEAWERHSTTSRVRLGNCSCALFAAGHC